MKLSEAFFFAGISVALALIIFVMGYGLANSNKRDILDACIAGQAEKINRE